MLALAINYEHGCTWTRCVDEALAKRCNDLFAFMAVQGRVTIGEIDEVFVTRGNEAYHYTQDNVWYPVVTEVPKE